ncbi:hypothetical protein BC826DRAFT_1161453, partial [Russula brevipes]
CADPLSPFHHPLIRHTSIFSCLPTCFVLTCSLALMMMFKFPTALLFFALGVSAAPTLRSVNLSQRDVWAPPVTSPDASTVWTVGSDVTVT